MHNHELGVCGLTGRPRKNPDESRHGQVASGWARQGMQIPLSFAKLFSADAAAWGPNSVKMLGSVGVGILLGMPREVREAMYLWMVKASRDVHDLDPTDVWVAFNRIMQDYGAEDDAHEPEWYVSRILDPEVTPPPGEKASDRARRSSGSERHSKGA